LVVEKGSKMDNVNRIHRTIIEYRMLLDAINMFIGSFESPPGS